MDIMENQISFDCQCGKGEKCECSVVNFKNNKCEDSKELKSKNKNRTYKIPVTWKVYGTVEVQAQSEEDALEEFHRIEKETEGFALPTENDYVDGSFRLSGESEEEILLVTKQINK